MTQDIIIGLLVVALGLTWIVGWRGHRRLSTEIDELARDRVRSDAGTVADGRR